MIKFFTFIYIFVGYKEYENFASARLRVLKAGDVIMEPQVGYAVLVENIPKIYCCFI